MSATDSPEKKRHGCFYYGCLVLAVVGLLAVVIIFLGFRYVGGLINAKLDQFAENQPMMFPKVEMPAGELKQLQQRMDAFGAAMQAHSNAPPLVLTSRDLNALIASRTNSDELKDICYVDIQGDIVKGELSLPLGKYFRFPFAHFKGRYLNGVGTFKVGVTNQELSVYVQSIEVKGKPLPGNLMMQIQSKNWAEDFNRDPTNAAVLGHFESIEVKDGKVTVKTKEQ
jgi:hypothetical protein